MFVFVAMIVMYGSTMPRLLWWHIISLAAVLFVTVEACTYCCTVIMIVCYSLGKTVCGKYSSRFAAPMDIPRQREAGCGDTSKV